MGRDMAADVFPVPLLAAEFVEQCKWSSLSRCVRRRLAKRAMRVARANQILQGLNELWGWPPCVQSSLAMSGEPCVTEVRAEAQRQVLRVVASTLTLPKVGMGAVDALLHARTGYGDEDLAAIHSQHKLLPYRL
eukprot:861638-Amphidinium_carterae.2